MRPSARFDDCAAEPDLRPSFASAAPGSDPDHVTAAATLALLRVRRERLAVLIGDVAGYSRLIQHDDVGTVVRLRHLRRHLIAPAVTERGGRLVRLAGDSVCAAFRDAPSAILCAVAIQRGLGGPGCPAVRGLRLELRIGISFEEVLVDDDGDLHGQGVIIAARLEELAPPGDVYLTSAVFDRLAARSVIRCEALGLRRLRGVARPVRVFRVAPAELGASRIVQPAREQVLVAAQ